MHEEIYKFIEEFKKDKPNAEFDYQNGKCFDFYLILKEKFPEARAWYDGNHVTTEIAGRFWDIRGLVNYPLEAEPNKFKGAKDWSKS